MKFDIKKMVFDQFKGFSHAEFDFTDKTFISGRNGSGKSTIFSGHTWLWTDKDSELKSNPEVHPILVAESEPSVTEVIELDGKTFTVRKYQKDNRTKKQKDANAPIKVSNCYEINSVPKSWKDFQKEMASYGINFDDFLLLSHLDIFTSFKTADARNLLFNMVEDVTDSDVAKRLPECKEVADLLDNYRLDEIQAMQKASKKRADERLKAIPEQIIGLETAKEPFDKESLDAEKAEAEKQLDEAQAQLKEVPDAYAIKAKILDISAEKERLTSEANKAVSDKRFEINKKLTEAMNELSKAKYAKSDSEAKIVRMKAELAEKLELKESLKRMWREVKSRAFDKAQTVCRYCGQTLPKDKVDELVKRFEDTRKNDLEHIASEGKNLAAQCELDEKLIEELVKAQEIISGKITDLSESVSKLNEERNALADVNLADSDEFQKLDAEKADLERQLSEMATIESERRTQLAVISDLQTEINAINRRYGVADANAGIDRKIASLQIEQKETAQALADAEKILYQCKLLQKAKNDLLTDSINKHFSLVKFRLFTVQKNEEVKDDCVVLINDNGMWKEYDSASNTALKTMARLDIVKGLSEYYDTYYPVFIDGAEELDSDSKSKLSAENQLILLSVSDGDLEVMK